MRAPWTMIPAEVSFLTSSAVPSSRLNIPEALRLRCRLISEWVKVTSFSRRKSTYRRMLSPNSGRVSPKKSAAAPQAAKVTFIKSGERPIIPQVERAQFSIIFCRVSSSSRVLGLANERPTRSPVCGDL